MLFRDPSVPFRDPRQLQVSITGLQDLPFLPAFKEIDIGELFHLIDVSFSLDDLFIVEQDPRFTFVRNHFADERYIMSAQEISTNKVISGWFSTWRTNPA